MRSDHRHHSHAGSSSEGLMEAERTLRKCGLKPGDVMLDAGCGPGYFSFAASKIVGPSGKVYAVDIWEDGIAAVRQRIEQKGITNMEAVVADLTEGAPFEHATVDLCFMANVMHGFVINNELDAAMNEISRMLKPGGRLAVVEWKKIDSPGPPIDERLAPQEVMDALSAFGYEKTLKDEVGQYHYCVFFIKQ